MTIKSIEVDVAEVRAAVLESGRSTGLVEVIGDDHFFPTGDTAIQFIVHSRDI